MGDRCLEKLSKGCQEVVKKRQVKKCLSEDSGVGSNLHYCSIMDIIFYHKSLRGSFTVLAPSVCNLLPKDIIEDSSSRTSSRNISKSKLKTWLFFKTSIFKLKLYF